MNEQVKEIADKIWSLDAEPNPHFNRCLQEFAELIVKECIHAVNNTDRTHAYTTFDKGLIDGTIGKSVQSIHQHFKLGV